MKNKLRRLMLFNFLFYANNLLVIMLVETIGLNGMAALWFFSPFVFIFFTTGLLEGSISEKTNSFKKLSIFDLGLRLLIIILNFVALSGMIKLSFLYLIAIGVLFLVTNIYLEWKLYRLLVSEHHSDDLLTKSEIKELTNDFVNEKTFLQDKSPTEKEQINNSILSTVLVGYTYILIFLLVGGGIFAFEVFGEQYRFIVLAIAILLLGIYFLITDKKLSMALDDPSERKRITIRDNLTFTIGLSIIYVLQGYIHIGTGTFNFLGIFFAVMFFIPTIKTNNQIRDSFHKVNKKYSRR